MSQSEDPAERVAEITGHTGAYAALDAVAGDTLEQVIRVMVFEIAWHNASRRPDPNNMPLLCAWRRALLSQDDCSG